MHAGEPQQLSTTPQGASAGLLGYGAQEEGLPCWAAGHACRCQHACSCPCLHASGQPEHRTAGTHGSCSPAWFMLMRKAPCPRAAQMLLTARRGPASPEHHTPKLLHSVPCCLCSRPDHTPCCLCSRPDHVPCCLCSRPKQACAAVPPGRRQLLPQVWEHVRPVTRTGGCDQGKLVPRQLLSLFCQYATRGSLRPAAPGRSPWRGHPRHIQELACKL